MKKIWLLLVTIALLAAPVSWAAAGTSGSDSAVFAGLLEHIACQPPTHGEEQTLTVVVTRTESYDKESTPQGVASGVVRSLKRRNKVTHKMPSVMACKNVRFVSWSKLKGILAKGGWDRFYKLFPHAVDVLQLTLPGYSKDGKTAVVQGHTYCKGLCGHGVYWVLKHTNGKWVVVHRTPTWLS